MKSSKEVKSFKIKFLFILWTKINLSDKAHMENIGFHGTYSVNAVLKNLKEGKITQIEK